MFLNLTRAWGKAFALLRLDELQNILLPGSEHMNMFANKSKAATEIWAPVLWAAGKLTKRVTRGCETKSLQLQTKTLLRHLFTQTGQIRNRIVKLDQSWQIVRGSQFRFGINLAKLSQLGHVEP